MEVKDKLEIDEAEGSSMMVLVVRIRECPEAEIVWVQSEIRKFIGILRGGRPAKASAPQAGTKFIKSQVLVIQDANSMETAWKNFRTEWPSSKKTQGEVEELWRTLHPLTVTPPAEAAGFPAPGQPEEAGTAAPGATETATPPPAEPPSGESKEKDPDVDAIVKKHYPGPHPDFKRGQMVRHKDLALRKDFGVGEIRRTDIKTTPGKILYMVKFPAATEWLKEEEIELVPPEGDVKK
jgi:hypothetical protein